MATTRGRLLRQSGFAEFSRIPRRWLADSAGEPRQLHPGHEPTDGSECPNENGTGLGGPGLAISPVRGATCTSTGSDDVPSSHAPPQNTSLNVSLGGTGTGACPTATADRLPRRRARRIPHRQPGHAHRDGHPRLDVHRLEQRPLRRDRYLPVTMSSDTQVTATFTANPPPSQATLTVSPAGTGSGTVSDGTGGISCPSTCSHAYATNTQVTLTETPGGGSTFAGWSGACSGTGTCQVTMSSDMQVTATFTAPPTPPAPGSPTPV